MAKSTFKNLVESSLLQCRPARSDVMRTIDNCVIGCPWYDVDSNVLVAIEAVYLGGVLVIHHGNVDAAKPGLLQRRPSSLNVRRTIHETFIQSPRNELDAAVIAVLEAIRLSVSTRTREHLLDGSEPSLFQRRPVISDAFRASDDFVVAALWDDFDQAVLVAAEKVDLGVVFWARETRVDGAEPRLLEGGPLVRDLGRSVEKFVVRSAGGDQHTDVLVTLEEVALLGLSGAQKGGTSGGSW